MQPYAGYKSLQGNVLRYTGKSYMTWGDFAEYFDPAITDRELEYLLWSETPYPFSSVRMTIYRLRSAIRKNIKTRLKLNEACNE